MCWNREAGIFAYLKPSCFRWYHLPLVSILIESCLRRQSNFLRFILSLLNPHNLHPSLHRLSPLTMLKLKFILYKWSEASSSNSEFRM
jgi:hypothetical protein